MSIKPKNPQPESLVFPSKRGGVMSAKTFIENAWKGRDDRHDGAPRKIQIFVGVATGFQWFQAFQVRNMAINRGALGTSINCHLAAFKRLEPLRSRCHSQKNLYFSRCPI